MSGSTHTATSINNKAGDDLPKANSNFRDGSRDDNSTSSSVGYDHRPVGNGRTNDSRDGQWGWRNNDNRENNGIIAGNNSTNSLNNGCHSGANMLGNASHVTVTGAALTNVSGISNNVSANPGPRNAPTDGETNGNSSQTTSPTDVGGRPNFPGTGRRLSDDTTTSDSDNPNSGLDDGTNTGDWSGNNNRGNRGIVAGHGSKNTINNGPSITANMFENASRITFNGGTYNNVAGRSNTVHADGQHPKQRRTM